MDSKMENTGYPHSNPPPYHQPQFHQPQFHQPPQPQVIIQQTTVPPTYVGPDPLQTVCPSCNATILTSIKHEPTTKTHLIALCLFCCVCWPCVCLPYCMDSCQNANHYCPNCSAFIGTYSN